MMMILRNRTMGQIDISAAVVTAANQIYTGNALTPTPTVVLDGSTIPSTGYDVTYSNNTNAGTATVTVTGKGDYTGTAIGTFTIAKAAPTYVDPAARSNLTYSGNSQYLITEGYTTDGTIQYSSDGSSWSTTRPSKTNAGNYTVYWRLIGDSNHTDVSSTSISVSIAKASRTLSFTDSYVVLNTSSKITKTATPSAGSGDGNITYSISSTTYATINSSSGEVTSKTSDGSAIVTVTIAEGTNYLSATASYNLYVFATTHNYDYNGSYRSVTLPPGTYQFQCWGAQGGSNAAASSYGITAKAGGKGGYSVGQLTVAQETGVRVYVGGQGSSSAGGFNGGGSTTGSSGYSSGNEYGTSRMGGGGGATDIRLSDGALLSRMIVAGGGGGGAMCYKKVTTSTTITKTINSSDYETSALTYSTANKKIEYSGPNNSFIVDLGGYQGGTIQLNNTYGGNSTFYVFLTAYPYEGSTNIITSSFSTFTGSDTVNIPSNATHIMVGYWNGTVYRYPESVVLSIVETSTTTNNESQVGYAGGGTNGCGYNSSFYGKQDGAGTGGAFGQGANQTAFNYRYCSGAGGGGWYGGGGYFADTAMACCKYSGGGSGWVNIAANASYRPSGYTGLQLDSGGTKAGNTSFPSTSGGTETGHSGDGYAKITRIS